MQRYSSIDIARLCRPIAMVLSIVSFLGSSAQGDDPKRLDFDRDIRPILQRHCMECHGPDDQNAGLRLDALKSIKQGGESGPAIETTEPARSLILLAIRGDESVSAMPPERDPLSIELIAKIETWIGQGAPGDESQDAASVASKHWSFQPIANPTPPTVQNPGWVRTPIDAFILARLEAEGIIPSPEADRSTLLRRVSLDLTGLPPTVEELDAFLLDNRPDAFERVVDRLLASPHYGERWGRHWLDQARYADSNGYTIDGPREMWKYRDWVIEATNRDLPFDQFVIEQLAGDLLPESTIEQRIATGFHRNTMINEEGGTDKEQFRVEAVNDRIATTGEVFLGLTTGCAQCHTHKFDPISHREYYQLFAFFNNADEPKIDVPTATEAEALAKIRTEIAQVQGQLKEREKALARQQADWEKEQQESLKSWSLLTPTSVSSAAGAEMEIRADQSILVRGVNGASDVYTIVANIEGKIASLRLEVLMDDSLPLRGPGRAGNGNFILSEVTAAITPFGDPTTSQKLAFAAARAEHSQPDFPIERVIDGDPKTGWAINTVDKVNANLDRVAILDVAEPAESQGKRTLVLRIEQVSGTKYNVGRLRLSVSAAPRPALIPAEFAKSLGVPAEERSKEQVASLKEWFFSSDAERSNLLASIAELKKKGPNPATAMVFAERKEPRDTFVHLRGDFLRHGPQVKPDVLQVLPPLPKEAPRDRLTFARWLMAADNPLTARVAVNRVWSEYFGLGLVETDNDFGTMGMPPTHPELLDWLATWYRDHAWSRKGLHKLIVTSATYRQASMARPELDVQDPRNRLLARQSRLRVDAEIVRDIALAVSGRLSHKIGGPSVFPYQPEGVMALAQVNRPWNISSGEDRFRRGMYTYFWRSTPHPFLKVFDAPDAQRCVTKRSRSNTPLQSLTLLNDQSLVDCAEGLADRIFAVKSTDPEERIRYAFHICLSRAPTQQEIDASLAFLLDTAFQDQSKEKEVAEAGAAVNGNQTLPGTGSEAPVRSPSEYESKENRRAYVAFARALLNLDELITRE